MHGIGSVDPGWGVTAVRLAMGLIFLRAGYDKLAGGIGALAEAFDGMAVPLPAVTAPFVALLEAGGGALLLIGLGSRWLGLLFALQFAYITLVLKLPAGWDAARFDVLLLAGSVLLFLAGGGRAAVDSAWPGRDGAAAGGRRAV